MLWRKMLRDILENKMAYIACAFVIAIGLMAYTSMSMAKDNLLAAKEQFYSEYNFADVFAKIKAMPYTRVQSLKEINGIKEVSGRLVKDVRVLMPDNEENVYLRLVSLNVSEKNTLNGVKLLKGALPDKNKREVLLADKFYTANNLQIGQKINVIIDGKIVEMTVSGSGQSPEFVYAMKEAQNIAPDPKAFEIAYVPYEDMENLSSQKGLVNDISFTLKSGLKFEDIEQNLKSELKKYELEVLYQGKDQLSNVMLSEELKQLSKMSSSLPVIFLVIAAIIQFIMLKRLIESQRGLIGTLKAFGYGSLEILVHYLFYGLFTGLIGGIFGGLFGTGLSISLIKQYQKYYSLPNLQANFSEKYFFLGIIMAVLFSLVASFQGVRGVMKLKPVDAMHPPVPVFVRKTWIEKIRFFWQMFNVQGRMAMRNALRNKGRSIFTFIGMVFTFGMMAAFCSIGNMADIMIMDQFTKAQLQDVKLSFSKPLPVNETVSELQHLNGINRIEPMLEVPITLRFKNYKRDVAALGIIEDSTLYNVFDKEGNHLQIPKTGMLLSQQVADKLNVQIGDVIQMDSIWAKDTKINIKVEKIVPQYLGSNVYMNQSELINILKQGSIATSALISMDKQYIPQLKDKYSTSKFVSNIEIRQEMIDKYKQLMGTAAYSLWFMAVISIVTGFAIVYNSSIISLAERKRELASLRVMGMTSKEVLEVISVEQWFIGIIGMIAGIPLAVFMNHGMSKSMSSDLYTIPAVTSPDALLQAFLGTILAIWIAQRWVSRKVRQLDLVEVLKERE